EFVADEKDGTATGTQIANDTKQPFGFLRGERSRRLIENEDATALADTTGDLEQLALTQCQRENGRAEIDRESHLIEPLTRLLGSNQGRTRGQAAARSKREGRQILQHGQMREQAQGLINRYDADSKSIPHRPE